MQTHEQSKIRDDNNIDTIESKLKYYRLNTYYRIRETHSSAYRNDKEYINNELKTLDSQVSVLTNHVNSKNEDILNNILRCKTISLIGKEHTKGKILRDGDIPIMDMAKSDFSFFPKLIIITAKNKPKCWRKCKYLQKQEECQGCGMIATLRSYSADTLEMATAVRYTTN